VAKFTIIERLPASNLRGLKTLFINSGSEAQLLECPASHQKVAEPWSTPIAVACRFVLGKDT